MSPQWTPSAATPRRCHRPSFRRPSSEPCSAFRSPAVSPRCHRSSGRRPRSPEPCCRPGSGWPATELCSPCFPAAPSTSLTVWLSPRSPPLPTGLIARTSTRPRTNPRLPAWSKLLLISNSSTEYPPFGFFSVSSHAQHSAQQPALDRVAVFLSSRCHHPNRPIAVSRAPHLNRRRCQLGDRPLRLCCELAAVSFDHDVDGGVPFLQSHHVRRPESGHVIPCFHKVAAKDPRGSAFPPHLNPHTPPQRNISTAGPVPAVACRNSGVDPAGNR